MLQLELGSSLFGILNDKAVVFTLKVCVGIPCFLIYNQT